MLTLFLWQGSQRVHEDHSDSEQSTGSLGSCMSPELQSTTALLEAKLLFFFK